MPETTHPGLPVLGYKPQSEDKITLVNHHKQLEELILRLMDGYKNGSHVDQRWLAIARTGLEQAFMALNRAIFQPGRVTLDGDPSQIIASASSSSTDTSSAAGAAGGASDAP